MGDTGPTCLTRRAGLGLDLAEHRPRARVETDALPAIREVKLRPETGVEPLTLGELGARLRVPSAVDELLALVEERLRGRGVGGVRGGREKGDEGGDEKWEWGASRGHGHLRPSKRSSGAGAGDGAGAGAGGG